MLNLPDLNRLKVFYAVYTYKSLIGAAQALNITRSAVSQNLKSLEGEMQSRLFLRDSKKTLPTEAGEILFRALKPLLEELQEAIQQIEIGKNSPQGHLRIGAPQDFGSTHLCDVIVDFHKKYQEITFEIELATPIKLLELVSEGKLDLAFVDNGSIHAKNYPVSIMTATKEKFVLACSKKYFESTSVSYKGLKDLRFIDYLPGAPVSKMWIRHHFGKVPYELNVIFSAESVRAVIKAIQGGLGVGVVPEHLIESDLKSGRLKVLTAPGSDLINAIALTRRLGRSPSAKEKCFIEFYRNYAEI